MLLQPVLYLLLSALLPQPNPPAPGAPAAQTTATKPNPDADGVYHYEKGVVSLPEILLSVEPEFPDKVRKRKLSAETVIRAVISPEGKVIRTEVIHSAVERYTDRKDREAAAQWDQAAIDAVRRYTFKPSVLEGKPVLCEIPITVYSQIF